MAASRSSGPPSSNDPATISSAGRTRPESSRCEGRSRMTTETICRRSLRATLILVSLVVLVFIPSGLLPAPKAKTTPTLECPSCDDVNSCTTDACDNDPDTARQGCFHVTLPDGTGCDDGNSCTQADVCNAGL